MNDETRLALVAELAKWMRTAPLNRHLTYEDIAKEFIDRHIDRLLTTRAVEPAADAVDVFDAADSDSWPPPEMKDAPLIRYLHKVMKYHQPTITPEECWVAIGAFRMWMWRHPDRASEMLQAAAVEPEPDADAAGITPGAATGEVEGE